MIQSRLQQIIMRQRVPAAHDCIITDFICWDAGVTSSKCDDLNLLRASSSHALSYLILNPHRKTMFESVKEAFNNKKSPTWPWHLNSSHFSVFPIRLLVSVYKSCCTSTFNVSSENFSAQASCWAAEWRTRRGWSIVNETNLLLDLWNNLNDAADKAHHILEMWSHLE